MEVLKNEQRKFENRDDVLKQIVHVSLENVMAGYDIKSFEDLKGTKLTRKYIEVKAVSQSDCQFYWSRNEIDKAKELENNYYLYLIPIGKNNVINMQDVRIIRNPYEEVYKNSKEWQQKVESVSFTSKASRN